MRPPGLLICVALLFLLARTARPLEDHPPPDKLVRVPCVATAYRQFDFWIGDWDVFEVEHPAIVAAHARVELILNGCVLHEIYEDLDGHNGESFSLYDATRKTWHQSWVNDSGYLLTIEGHLQDKSMILEGVDQMTNCAKCQPGGRCIYESSEKIEGLVPRRASV